MSYFVRSSTTTPHNNYEGGRPNYMPKRILRYKGSAFIVTQFPTKPPVIYPRKSRKTGWTQDSVRTGVIARKVGMEMEWDEWGALRPLTLMKVEENHVVEVKSEPNNGYTALKIGAGSKKLKRMRRSEMGICAHAGIPPKRWMMEFKVSPDAVLPVGSRISAMHFIPGQKISVTGISKGKGFQGVMKRWGFSGGAASHGNSLAHRIPGSTGQRQDPGRVFPGKKMPGRMGNKKATMAGLTVYAVYPKKNMIAVIGGVPGAPGGMVQIRDTPWYRFTAPPPFPTWLDSTPDKEILRGHSGSPWWYEQKIDKPRALQAIIAAELKKLEDRPMTDQFWSRMIKDEVNRQQSVRWPSDLDAKIITEGKRILDERKKEADEARKIAKSLADGKITEAEAIAIQEKKKLDEKKALENKKKEIKASNKK